MAQLTVRKLDEDLVRRLKVRAAQKGRSAEAEHRAILREVLTGNADDFWEEARKMRDELREKYGTFPDSAPLIRRMRDERAGLIEDE